MDKNATSTYTLFEIAQDYIKNMINQVTGMKSIILDKETKTIFSLVATKSGAIKEEIFMFEDIENLKDQKMLNVKGIFFIRPSETNLVFLENILANPNFSEINLHFTNFVKDDYLKKIASFDNYNSVKNVQETYFDYYIINHNFFHLGLESTIGLTNNIRMWKNYDNLNFKRLVDGIIGVLLSNRANPVIKVLKGSDITHMIATHIMVRFTYFTLKDFYEKNSDIIVRYCGREKNSQIFFFDRKEDPLTPLLSQWTYQVTKKLLH